jgi:transcriptional regulator with XRE-family HTH domain
MASKTGPHHDLTARVAYNLRRLRIRAGWTQDQAAQQLGGTTRAQDMSRYENAHIRPSDLKLLRLAKVYGVDVSELFADVPAEDAGERS